MASGPSDKKQKGVAVPWLSDEVPGWDEMTAEEQEAFRAAIRDLGMEVVDEDDEDTYFE